MTRLDTHTNKRTRVIGRRYRLSAAHTPDELRVLFAGGVRVRVALVFDLRRGVRNRSAAGGGENSGQCFECVAASHYGRLNCAMEQWKRCCFSSRVFDLH